MYRYAWLPKSFSTQVLQHNTNRKIRLSYWLVTFWILFAIVTLTSLVRAEESKQSKVESKPKSDFVLTIKDNFISLNAKDASLEKILEEIGRSMKIKIISTSPEETKVTVKFEKLPLEAAIEALRDYADIAYIRESEDKSAKITKILVFPKGKEGELSKHEIKKEEKELAKPETRTSEEIIEEKTPQTGSKESVKKEPQQPKPFKFEFDPSEFEEGK